MLTSRVVKRIHNPAVNQSSSMTLDEQQILTGFEFFCYRIKGLAYTRIVIKLRTKSSHVFGCDSLTNYETLEFVRIQYRSYYIERTTFSIFPTVHGTHVMHFIVALSCDIAHCSYKTVVLFIFTISASSNRLDQLGRAHFEYLLVRTSR